MGRSPGRVEQAGMKGSAQTKGGECSSNFHGKNIVMGTHTGSGSDLDSMSGFTPSQLLDLSKVAEHPGLSSFTGGQGS